jgi:hypothetical protein
MQKHVETERKSIQRIFVEGLILPVKVGARKVKCSSFISLTKQRQVRSVTKLIFQVTPERDFPSNPGA